MQKYITDMRAYSICIYIYMHMQMVCTPFMSASMVSCVCAAAICSLCQAFESRSSPV